jgi:hypothetical protein
MSIGEGTGARVGRRQGWSNGSQAAVQRGRDMLLPAAAADAAAADVEALIGGEYNIASRQPPK